MGTTNNVLENFNRQVKEQVTKWETFTLPIFFIEMEKFLKFLSLSTSLSDEVLEAKDAATSMRMPFYKTWSTSIAFDKSDCC